MGIMLFKKFTYFKEVFIYPLFYCLFYVEEMPIDMLEEQVSGGRDPYLNEE